MPRSALTLLIAAGLLLSARLGWTETASPAASTAAPAAVEALASDQTAAAPAASTAAAPAATSAPAAQATASAAPAASTASAPAAATAAVQTAASTPAAAAPAPEPAPAPAATPTASAAPAQVMTSGGTPQIPVRGMDMANVEHIFGTPLEKQDAVGKPPITRWVYSDYIVYFEYNKVLHTVMKAGPFADSKAPGDG